MTHQTQPASCGFNLIELLSVIAIIGIFAAILIFMVGKVIAPADSLVCASITLLRA